ncbi:MAG TPA: alpha/beta hydrolase [Anaerolineaceae bacterium]|nr:alpha/beta hydrolase [Anaerolineaceae bacterium]
MNTSTLPNGQAYAQIGPARVFYKAAGAGCPLVLLHGLSGSGRWWARNVPALAQHFQVFTLDLAGFGRSRGRPFVLAETPALVARFCDEMGLDRVSLIGHSMGGYIAASLAARFPERIDRLVLVDAVLRPIEGGYSRAAWSLVQALRYLPVDFLPVLAWDTLRAGPFTMGRAIPQVLQADLGDGLGRIRQPALVVWGEYDTLLPVRVGEAAQRSLPGSDLVVIPGAGHNPMWDRPAEFNRIVLERLTRPQ